MKLLLRLYPGWWRRRYGAEAVDILESRPVTPSVFWNVVIGAVDAWLNQGMPPNSADDTNQGESGGGYLMTGNRRRNKRAASVLAVIGLLILVGAVVFVEAYRTIQGHQDGAAGPINSLAGSPFVVLGIATAGLGLWILLTGRRVRNWPRWPFEGRARLGRYPQRHRAARFGLARTLGDRAPGIRVRDVRHLHPHRFQQHLETSDDDGWKAGQRRP